MGNSSHHAEQAQSRNLDKKKAKEDADPGLKKPGSKAQGRKRTKTGCLTCRKRRIKCGEEKPTCQNCAKSKRQCEGYNQRVVFKDPLNAYRGPAVSSQVSFTEPVSTIRYSDPVQQPLPVAGPLPIAPKPQGSLVVTQDNIPLATLPAVTTPGAERRVYGFNTSTDYPPSSGVDQHAKTTLSFDKNGDSVDHSYIPEPRIRKSPQDLAAHYDFDALESIKQESRDDPSGSPAIISPLEWSAGPSTSSPFYHPYSSSSNWQPLSHSQPSVTGPHSTRSPTSATTQSSPNTLFLKRERLPDAHEMSAQTRQAQFQPQPSRDYRRNWDQQTLNTFTHSPIEDDDDPFDVSDNDDSENEHRDVEQQGDVQEVHLRNNDLGVLVALQARQDTQGLSLRSFTSFIDRPDMLSTYIPSPQSSPLRDSMTARVFYHFINVTGPSMSMFERHPANPSLIFQGHPVPRSQQHIWTYTFPTLALQNQGLLHAMLALASLHIAKLQNGPITASLKHYAFGLRRVAKSVSLPTRRGQPATLAAAMLLAFYECWSAEHQKWSNHLLGARMLVKEIDFVGMTRQIKSIKAQQRREEQARDYHLGQNQQDPRAAFNSRTSYQRLAEDVDENIVAMLMGKKPRYDEYGRILDDDLPDNGRPKAYTQRDFEIYETQRDLFWWYCKQDTYQSILGGGKLFMDYDRWSHCPPRAPLGRLNATYGTFDHLILLMGRLADFTSKDIKRKRLALKANGVWRPPITPTTSSQMSGKSAVQGPQQNPTAVPSSQIPAFSGMVPGVIEAKLPMGFEPSRDQSPQSTRSDEMDLDAMRVEAEEEWQEIRHAFSVLEDHFGDDFQALGPEFSAPIQTPFGTALQYRTYGIAGIWMNYYMALIACHRAHPSMPPAAMMAASITAQQTAFFANEIGRISAGISPDCSMTTQVSPGVGAALIESSTCLFVAGVQYQNAAQRKWTVDRLRDVARLTGWQTALAIVTGCETSWVKVGEVGKGPPYTRTSEERVVPDIWHNARRLDRALMGVNDDERLVIARSDRVHYALGVLGVEEDFENLDLDNDEQPE